MIDARALRQDAEEVARALARKRFTLDVAQYRALEERRKGCDVEIESSTVETRGSVNWRKEK